MRAFARICQPSRRTIDAVPAQPAQEPRRQERGRRRIESILDAAEAVIAEVGYDAATTNQIAARAAISPGSLYQYFANKPAIVEALGRRFLAHLTEANQRGVFTPGLAALPLPELVDRVVDPLVAFNLAHPAAKSLLAGADLSPDLAAATVELHDALCDRVKGLIAERVPGRSAADNELAANVSIQIFAGVLPSIVAAGPRERPRVVREVKAALVGYWASLENP
jgi:AcrR family transcriptional regulator